MTPHQHIAVPRLSSRLDGGTLYEVYACGAVKITRKGQAEPARA